MTSVVQPTFFEATGILFVHKENKIMTIFNNSSLPCQSLTCVHDSSMMHVLLLSMQGQKVLGFQQKYLNLCSEDERMSNGFGTS